MHDVGIRGISDYIMNRLSEFRRPRDNLFICAVHKLFDFQLFFYVFKWQCVRGIDDNR